MAYLFNFVAYAAFACLCMGYGAQHGIDPVLMGMMLGISAVWGMLFVVLTRDTP